MRTMMLIATLVAFGAFSGEDLIAKTVAERNAVVLKAKELYDKAEDAANTKMVTDLKTLLKKGGDKVAIATEILKVMPQDQEAYDILNKEGKLAELGKDLAATADSEMGKAVYKVWSDKSKLDLNDTGLMDTLEGGKYTKNPKMQDQFVQVTTVLVIPENGEYKALTSATKAKVTLNGKPVDWSKPTVIALPKGRYTLVAEFETFQKTFSIQFGKKSDASLEPLKAPYMETDVNALKELKRNKNR